MAKTRPEPDTEASAGKKKKVLKKGPRSSQIAKSSQIVHRKGPFSSQPAQVDYVTAEDHLLTLPNIHSTDMLAQQFYSMMVHEGHVKEDARIQLKPNRVNLPLGNQSTSPNNAVAEMQQYGEAIPGQSSNEVAKPASGSNAPINLSQNLVTNPRMLTPGNPQALQMPQGLLSGLTTCSTATTASAAAATKSTHTHSTAESPVPEVSYDAWDKPAFTLESSCAELIHAVW